MDVHHYATHKDVRPYFLYLYTLMFTEFVITKRAMEIFMHLIYQT